MKELVLQYAAYNIWANNRLIDSLLKLSEDKLDQEINSSFSSIRATVYHTWSAEHIWLERLQLAEYPVWMQAVFKGTFAGACAEWQKASRLLVDFVAQQQDDNALTHVVQYTDKAGNTYKTPVYLILHHVFNHSTYHRGQLITMLRQAGATEVPGTDFISFARKKI